MKILTAETDLTSATNISKAPVVRVYNSDSSAITLTRKSNAGTTIGTYSVPPSKVIYCQKFYTDTLEGGAALKATGVGYSEELDIICLGNGGDGGGIDNTDTDLLLHIDPSNNSSYNGSGSTVTDLSTYSNDGTLESNVGYNSTEGGGSFYVIDQSGSQIIFTPITINHTAATVEIWLRNTTTHSNTVFAIANNTNNSWQSRVMSVHVPYLGTVYFDGGDGDDGTENRIDKTDPTDITTKWYHWTFVLSTTEQKIHLNGVEWESGSGCDDGVGTDGPAAHTTINFYDTTGRANFEGYIGAVRVWKKALSESDALANFNLDKVKYGYE